MDTSSRRLDVLKAVVAHYVSTREPVGSRAIVEHYDLGVSPATIRNDMAVLEEQGYIYQPHTSAGRIPTKLGYRLFVDRLAQVKPMSEPERRAIESFLADAVDIDEVIEGTVRLLSQLTRQVAVVEYPRPTSARMVRVELVELSEHALLVVVICDDGSVDQRVVVTPVGDEYHIDEVRRRVNDLLVGISVDDVERVAVAQRRHDPVGGPSIERVVLDAVADTVRARASQRVVVAGTGNLARSGHDFHHSIVPVLDALEEQVALLRLFSHMTPQRDVTVSIGDENQHDGLAEASIVTGTYGDDHQRAHLAVIGPMRMDYAGAMSAVHAIGGYLSHFISQRR